MTMQPPSLINLIARQQAVLPQSVSEVDSVNLASSLAEIAKMFFKPRSCFSNSFNLTEMGADCDVVVGYVYLPEFDITIEHAWNADATGHFDLTAQLFWEGALEQNKYAQLVRLDNDEARYLIEEFGGVDTTALRCAPEYRHLFGKQ
ncbi:MAG: hypothetical protein ACRDD9_18120 [Shewanella sp.]